MARHFEIETKFAERDNSVTMRPIECEGCRKRRRNVKYIFGIPIEIFASRQISLYPDLISITNSTVYPAGIPPIHVLFFLSRDTISIDKSILTTNTELSIVICSPSQVSSMSQCHEGKNENLGPSLTLKRHSFPSPPTLSFLPEGKRDSPRRRRKKGGGGRSKGNSFTFVPRRMRA